MLVSLAMKHSKVISMLISSVTYMLVDLSCHSRKVILLFKDNVTLFMDSSTVNSESVSGQGRSNSASTQ